MTVFHLLLRSIVRGAGWAIGRPEPTDISRNGLVVLSGSGSVGAGTRGNN